MMVEFKDIEELVQSELGEKRQLLLTSTLQSDLCLTGDDLNEFLEKYANKFDVNMEGYLWYFHTPEEPFFNLFSMVFKTPDKRVSQIPVTLEMLQNFANLKEWSVEYPDHSIPKRRYDVILMYAVLFLIISFVLYTKYG